MNIQRKTIDIEINGKDYVAVLDFGAAIYFEGLTGKSILIEIQKISQEQSMSTLANVMASVIKKGKNKSVGIDFISELDLVNGMEYFIEKMTELFENSLPQTEDEDEEDKKKIVEMKKND